MVICQIDKSFYRTIPFYLKIAELICCVVLWICVGSNQFFVVYGGGVFINFSSTLSFIMTAILFIFYLLGVIQRLPGPWVLIEAISIGISMLLLAICIILSATRISSYGDAAAASTAFCIFGLIIYAAEFGLRFKFMRTEGAHFTVQQTSAPEPYTSNPPESTQNEGGPYVIKA